MNKASKNNKVKKDNALKRLFQESAIESFPPFFKDTVMAKLLAGKPAEEIQYNVFKRLFRPLSIVTAGLILILTVYNIASHGSLSVDALIGLPEITIDHLADAMAVE